MPQPSKPIATAADAWAELRVCLDRVKPGCSLVVPQIVATLLLREHDQVEEGSDVTD